MTTMTRRKRDKLSVIGLWTLVVGVIFLGLLQQRTIIKQQENMLSRQQKIIESVKESAINFEILQTYFPEVEIPEVPPPPPEKKK